MGVGVESSATPGKGRSRIFEPCQPKHWEVRRKHIADSPKGAASRHPARRGASEARDGPSVKCKRLDARAERDPLRTML